MARKGNTKKEVTTEEPQVKLSTEERINNLLQSRQQMQQGLLKIEGAIEVLSAVLEEEKNGKEK